MGKLILNNLLKIRKIKNDFFDPKENDLYNCVFQIGPSTSYL